MPEAGREDERDAFPARAGVLRMADLVGITVILAAAVALRFVTTSPMWLDEALTVNIARLPLGEIPGALRHDGHPPLYYFLLHGWMSLFGTSDLAIRSLAGIFGILTLPLTWLATRRLGGRAAAWSAVLLFGLMPFAVRYGTENRMYSLLMVLSLVGWLLAERTLVHPRRGLLVALAVVTAALLWTHYWALWLGLTAAIVLAWRWRALRRAGEPEAARAVAWTLGALAAGFAAFLPWVPTLLYQGAHTGTPWASRSWPTTILAVTIQDLGGGGKADSQLFGWFMVIAALVGVLGIALDRRRILLDVRGGHRTRAVALLVLGTLGFAAVVGAVTNSAFQARYNAVWIPFWVMLAGCGLAQLRGPVLRRVVLVVILVVALPGAVRNVIDARTQAGAVAENLHREARSGDVVVLCPDQLGPSLLRALDQEDVAVAGQASTEVPVDAAGLGVIGYPGFVRPDRVDWVDYDAGLRRVTPEAYAQEVSHRYAGHQLFVAWDGTYRTHTQLCERFNHELARLRGGSTPLVTNSSKTYEHEWLVRYGPQEQV